MELNALAKSNFSGCTDDGATQAPDSVDDFLNTSRHCHAYLSWVEEGLGIIPLLVRPPENLTHRNGPHAPIGLS